MFSRQKGFITILIFFFGFCLMIVGIFVIPSNFPSIFPDGFPKTLEFARLFKAALLLIASLVFILFGVIIMGLFPSIRITDTGIKVKGLLWVHRFDWNEVDEIVKLSIPSGAKGVILSPKGNLIKRLIINYPFYLHGVISGAFEPVVILSNGLENRDEIITEITKHISEK